MCSSACNFTKGTKILSENEKPLFIDTNIFINLLPNAKKNELIEEEFKFTKESKRSFIKLLETGKNYIIIIPGNKFFKEICQENNNVNINNLINLYKSGENSIKTLILKKSYPDLNSQFEDELNSLINNHWPCKKKNKKGKIKRDPEVMLAIYWFDIKNIFTTDNDCSNFLKEKFEEYMGEKKNFQIEFDPEKYKLSKIIDYDFVNNIK